MGTCLRGGEGEADRARIEFSGDGRDGQDRDDCGADAEQQDGRIAAQDRNAAAVCQTVRDAAEAERGYEVSGWRGGEPESERVREDGGD